ncbi:hypothetical protein ACTFIW_003609 [Dictyostelium discoideum]
MNNNNNNNILENDIDMTDVDINNFNDDDINNLLQQTNIYTNDILFINHLNEWIYNVSIIKDTLNQINTKNTRLYLILINTDLSSIESISNILSKYYSILSNYTINQYFKLNIDCVIILPELYYNYNDDQFQNENNNNNNKEMELFLNSIELIFNSFNNTLNKIYIPNDINNNNNNNKFNEFIKSIEILKPSPYSSSSHNYFDFNCYSLPPSNNNNNDKNDNLIINFNYKSIKRIQRYGSVYCGGFFDYLHFGHKTFLSIGSLLAKDKFFISVLQKSSFIFSSPSPSTSSSPIKCPIAQINKNNNQVKMNDNTTNSPSNSIYNSNNINLTPIRYNTSPSILQQQLKQEEKEEEEISPKTPKTPNTPKTPRTPRTPITCPYSHDSINGIIKSSKSSIGEIKNFNYDYYDKNNDRLMQPIQVRMNTIIEFLDIFNPFHSLIEVVTNTRCSDINYCPMTLIDNVDSIITIPSSSFTTSSLNNTHKINLVREKRNLKPISIHLIETVQCYQSNNKISSSYIRSLLNDFNKCQ